MKTKLSPDSLPVLSPHAVIDGSGDALTVDTPDAEIRYTGAAARLLAALAPDLTGSRSLADLAEQHGASQGYLCDLLTPLADSGGLGDLWPVLHPLDVEAQLAGYYAFCDGWARDIFVRPFWTALLAGTAPRPVVLGWCVEFYHRTVGADEHNALSVEHCTDPEIRRWLSAHFEEEVGHGEMFLAGLAACGLDRKRLAGSPPLPSTRALIDYMGGLAQLDSIAYLGCYGVLHSPRQGQTLDRARQQFDGFADLYPFAAPAFRQVKAHAEIDLAAGHDQIALERLIRTRGALPPGDAYRVMRAAHGMVVVFSRFFDGILAHYGRLDGADLLADRPVAAPSADPLHATS